MKASELIERLAMNIGTWGDLEVKLDIGHREYPGGPWVSEQKVSPEVVLCSGEFIRIPSNRSQEPKS